MSTPSPGPSPTPAPLLIVGDDFGHNWVYNIGGMTAPASPLPVNFANNVLAAGGGIVATVGDGTVNALFRQSFTSNGKLYGVRIPIGHSGIDQLNTAICVDGSGNVYVTTGQGYVVFRSAVGTLGPFATVKAPGARGGGIAAAPDGTIALEIVSSSSFPTTIERFSSVKSGSQPISFLNIFGRGFGQLAFDPAGRLFLSIDNFIVVYGPNATASANPITMLSYNSASPTIAVDANDVAYVLSSDSFGENLAAYRFSGTGLSLLWSMPSPPFAHWVAVLR